MRCPYCQAEDTQVKDSRPTEEGSVIRRRRVCSVCIGRFTTFERIQLRDLLVIKKDGRCEPFERNKIMHSVQLALRKRNVDQSRIERALSGIIRQLENSGDIETTTEKIGHLAMEALKTMDDVGYIRFASVYQNFCNASDFRTAIEELAVQSQSKENSNEEY